MKYIDLHCDALTKEGAASVTAESLRAGGCLLQCFAAYTPRADLAETLALCDKFDALVRAEGYLPAEGNGDGVRALLTVENVTARDLCGLDLLIARGAKIMGITWNFANALGFPCGDGRGLTPFGRDCVERMAERRVLPDVSHGSDALVRDIAELCNKWGAPFVASHANAREVFFHPRNLSDEGVRAVAESGGVVGLCFVEKFLAADGSAAGQRSAILAHARHIVKTGGEEVLALGSDFDGAPANAYIKNPADMPKLLWDLERAFGARIAEKIAFGNAKRVLGRVQQ